MSIVHNVIEPKAVATQTVFEPEVLVVTVQLDSAAAAAAFSVSAANSAAAAANSASTFTANFAQLAASLILTQTIVVGHIGFM